MPDSDRADGHVRLTRPAVIGERLVRDVSLTFAGRRLVEIAGGDGIQTLREFIARDPGMRHLGEIAFVDGDSAVGHAGQTFGMISLDENVAPHIALGSAFPSSSICPCAIASTRAATTST